MTAAFAITVGFLLAVAVICGVVAAFLAHGYLWERFPERITAASSGLLGGATCAALVFVMFWSLNPDPPQDNQGRPTVGATATMTAFSGLLWLPLYLYAFAAMARRRSHG